MDEQTLELWQSLHHRTACGEMLSAEEQDFYQTELARMDAEEDYPKRTERLKVLRDKIQRSEQEQIRLRRQSHALKQQIAGLEALLDERNRQPLTAGA